MKKIISLFLFVTVILAGTITPLAESPTITLDGPKMTISYYRTGKDIKEGKPQHMSYDREGVLVFDGILYTDSSRDYIVPPDNHIDGVNRFMMNGKTYDLIGYQGQSFEVVNIQDDQEVGGYMTYILANPRTTVQADYDDAYTVQTHMTTVDNDSTKKEYNDIYLIDGKNASEDEYIDYRSFHSYRETTSNVYKGEKSRTFTGGNTKISKIEYYDGSKTVSLSEEDPIPGNGIVMYYYVTTDSYDVVDLYERTHSLTTTDPAPSTDPVPDPTSDPAPSVDPTPSTDPKPSTDPAPDPKPDPTPSADPIPSADSKPDPVPSVDPKPNETKPAETKPAETKPETKPADTSYRTSESIIVKTVSNDIIKYKDVYSLNGKKVSKKEYRAAKKGSWSENLSIDLLESSDPVYKDSELKFDYAEFIYEDGTRKTVKTDSSGNPLEQLSGPGTLCLHHIKTETYDVTKTYERLHALTVTSAPVIKTPKAGNRSITVRWKKSSQKISGYQIQISRNKNFKNAKRIKAGKKLTSKKIKNLRKKTSYYVRIRTYQGNTHSHWSKVKKVKTK